MVRRVFIIHGWEGNPNKDWIPWIKLKLQNKGYKALAPLMPDTDNPIITAWLEKVVQLVGEPKKEDVFIGHSIGCQTILRYLEQLSEDQRVDKVILVAAWFKLINLENEQAWKIAQPWLETPINFKKVKSKANLFTTVFSDNDPWVPLDENKKLFDDKLNSKAIILHNMGHFTEEDGVKSLPEILELL